jgi:hypothetical protein
MQMVRNRDQYLLAQLKDLANQGIITPQTELEADGGHRGKAHQVKGLFPPPPENPCKSAADTAATTGVPTTIYLPIGSVSKRIQWK